jgi:hypothetical protein
MAKNDTIPTRRGLLITPCSDVFSMKYTTSNIGVSYTVWKGQACC